MAGSDRFLKLLEVKRLVLETLPFMTCWYIFHCSLLRYCTV